MLHVLQEQLSKEIKVRKILTALWTACIFSGLSVSFASAVTISKPEAVIELFTSQGCHSCPPADKLMGKIDREGKYLTLNWHVDYWDYLGWKDIFATPDNTQRQYGYARALRERQVYTPQAIVNGRDHSVGSDERKVRGLATTMAAANKGLTVPIKVEKGQGGMSITIEQGDVRETATLHMVFFNKTQEVEIARGENAGKTLKYHNVVGRAQPLGLVKSDGFAMTYPIGEMLKTSFDGCALILQTNDAQGNPSAILGAVVISDL